MEGVGRNLQESPSPTPLPKQGHLQQAAQGLVQASFEYLQRRRLHNPTGQPVPVLCHPQSEEVLPHVQLELPMGKEHSGTIRAAEERKGRVPLLRLSAWGQGGLKLSWPETSSDHSLQAESGPKLTAEIAVGYFGQGGWDE